MKNFTKKILRKLGYQINRTKNIELINRTHFTPIFTNDKDWELINEGFKKSKNIFDDFLTKVRFYSLAQCVKHILNKKKVYDFVELGCWKGHSAYIISKLIKKSRKKINFHIFDSFEGLSDSCKKDGTFNLYNNKFKSAVTKQFQSSEDFVKDIVLKDFNFVKTYKGWIPNRFNEIKEKKFSLIHIDLCMYKPSLQSLNFFYPKLVKGGIIISNVYNSEVFQGEKKAWDEYFQNKKNKFYFKHALNGCFLLK